MEIHSAHLVLTMW